MLVDSHCHLNYPQFEDLEAVLRRAREQGVMAAQTISTKREDFAQVVNIAEQHNDIYGSIGIHPHEADGHQDISVEELVTWASHPKIIAIGETGLDYYYEHSARDAQQRSFRTHIEAARQLDLPVIVHSRDADEDTVAILHEAYQQASFKGLIHCFSTTKYLSDKAREIGFYISIAGIITFKKSDALRDIVKDIPLQELLVETDSPYLAPVPMRGKTNEPAYTAYVAEEIAKIHNTSIEEVARITTNNFYTLFSKATRTN